MVFQSSVNVERFYFHPAGEENNVYWIELITSADDSTFVVSCCCADDWSYEFTYTKSDYNRVMYNIMETAFRCDTMEEVLDKLSELFEDGFKDILFNNKYDD